MSVLPWAREISEIRFEADDHTFGADALGQLLENVPVALSVTLGRDHRYVFANRLFRNVMQPRNGQLIGRTVFEILGDLYTPEARAIRERVLGTGEPFEASGVPISIVSDAPPRYWDL
jgi:PAS domain-containing protein